MIFASSFYFYNKPEYVLAIADKGNISCAAESLHVSQSTLTMYLNRLESEFGAVLFDRTVRPIKLTQAGQLYVETLRAIGRTEQDFMVNLHSLLNPNETLNIGVGPIRSKLFLPAPLLKIREMYPHVSINLSEHCDADLPSNLYNGKHDFIFGCFDATALLFADVIPLGSEVVGLIAPNSYFNGAYSNTSPSTPQEISIRQLNHLPIIIPSQGNDLHPYIIDVLRRFMIEPDSIIMTKSTLTAIAMVSNGLGYAFIEYPFLKAVREDDLSHIVHLSLKEEEIPSKNIVAAFSANSIKKDMFLKVIELLKESYTDVSL